MSPAAARPARLMSNPPETEANLLQRDQHRKEAARDGTSAGTFPRLPSFVISPIYCFLTRAASSKPSSPGRRPQVARLPEPSLRTFPTAGCPGSMARHRYFILNQNGVLVLGVLQIACAGLCLVCGFMDAAFRRDTPLSTTRTPVWGALVRPSEPSSEGHEQLQGSWRAGQTD